MIDESMDRSFTYYSNFFIDIVGYHNMKIFMKYSDDFLSHSDIFY